MMTRVRHTQGIRGRRKKLVSSSSRAKHVGSVEVVIRRPRKAEIIKWFVKTRLTLRLIFEKQTPWFPAKT